MNVKVKVFIFIILIATVTGYFLWQIDRHEKALLGFEWLNPVPANVWNKYLKDKQEYEDLYYGYIDQNPEIMSYIKQYRNVKLTRNDITQINASAFYIPEKGRVLFWRDHREEHKKWLDIVKDMNSHDYKIPTPSNPPKTQIEQRIDSLYRYMISIDAILVLALGVSLFLYRKQSVNESMSQNKLE